MFSNHQGNTKFNVFKRTNPFPRLLKPPIIKPPSPDPEFLQYILKRGQYRSQLKLLTQTNVPKFIRIRTTFQVPKTIPIIIKIRDLIDLQGFSCFNKLLIRVLYITRQGIISKIRDLLVF